MNEYVQYLSELIPDKDSLKIVKAEAKKYYREHTAQECHEVYLLLYDSDNFQIQEVGVFLAGYIADEYPDALAFLHDTVSRHESWKVQEILAMAFDNYCAGIGYENALPLIKSWFADENANIRRAASEGLRVWTSRPYFKDHPKEAVALLASHKEDESEYVRKSAGNSLRDISRKFPELVASELYTWDLSSKKVMQVYKLAGRHLEAKGMNRLKLVEPSKEYEEQVMSYREAFLISGDSFDGCAGLEDVKSYEDWLDFENRLSERYGDGYVPSTVCLAVRKEDNRLVGIIDYRHELTDFLMHFGGNIGYSVLPSERGKGYAKEMLGLMIERCRESGAGRLLLTCDKTNTASARTILSNGGVLENETADEAGLSKSGTIQRYWITLGEN